jgi:hypothetical protein
MQTPLENSNPLGSSSQLFGNQTGAIRQSNRCIYLAMGLNKSILCLNEIVVLGQNLKLYCTVHHSIVSVHTRPESRNGHCRLASERPKFLQLLHMFQCVGDSWSSCLEIYTGFVCLQVRTHVMPSSFCSEHFIHCSDFRNSAKPN